MSIETGRLLDQSLDDCIAEVLADADAESLNSSGHDIPIYELVRYHLGYLDENLRPALVDRGKRLRSKLCAYACLAAGGSVDRVIPTASAIELLHNFTLVHDDIQDRSLSRRHRPTIWSTWGDAQAINAGDTLFVLAHLALARQATTVEPTVLLALSRELHRTTLRIVEGQVLDLGFEEREDVTAAEYLNMIGGKTAAICRFATWAGALVAGATNEAAGDYGEFGLALGIGFQLRDDVLGIWGSPGETGKDLGDIERRKKSYPILLLFERADREDRAELGRIYAQSRIDAPDVAAVMAMLRDYGVEPATQDEARRWHQAAEDALERAQPGLEGGQLLSGLVRQLAVRSS